MVITLIGLSGCGKSHLAVRLQEEKGFVRFCCDDLIEERLAAELKEQNYQSIAGVAAWMGQPYEPHFNERQQRYLECEAAVMDEIIEYLGPDGWGLQQDVVIDTSGSVIYTGDRIMAALKKRSRLIYLGVPESEFDFMFQQYLSDPKPVIWGDLYRPREDETDEQALARCFPELIRHRSKLYHQYADVTLIMDRENRDRFSVARLLNLAGAK